MARNQTNHIFVYFSKQQQNTSGLTQYLSNKIIATLKPFLLVKS